MTTKTMKELVDELREAQDYRDDSVGEACFDFYHNRVQQARDALYKHPETIAMQERFAREREERVQRCRAFYADPANKGRHCI